MKQFNNSSCHRLGFTIIEILVVISIIGLLIGAAAVSLSKAQIKGRDSKRKADLKAVQEALERYYNKFGTYPAFSGPMGTFPFYCGATYADKIEWGASFTCDGITFMERLPLDPKFAQNSAGYVLNSPSPYQSYRLSAALENTSDPEYCSSSTSCPNLPCIPYPATSRTYCVSSP